MTNTKNYVEEISKRFDDSKIKWKGKYAYISHALITERLNEVDPAWSSRVIAEHTYADAQGRLHCEGVTLGLTVGGTERVETGGPQRQDGFALEMKNAYSDAFKRCAMRFGAALYMWDKLVDAEYDEDVNPEYQATTPTRELSPKIAAHFAEGYKIEAEANLNLPNYPGQNAFPPGPGAARLDAKPERNAPRPAQQQERVAPPQVGKYGDHAPSGKATKLVQVNEYLRANGFTGGNTGECIREVEQWVHETFHTDDKIIATGPVSDDPAKAKYGPGTLPADIFDYAFHFISQCDVDEEATAAVTAAAGGTHLAPDEIPF